MEPDDLPDVFLAAVGIQWSILCIFHLFLELIKDWFDFFESLGSFAGSEGSDFGH